MAHSVEVRLPFLDRRVAEFALSLPSGLLFRGNVTKRVLRDAFRGLVPDVVLDRREKVGYETPEAMWFNSATGTRPVGEILLDPALARKGLLRLGRLRPMRDRRLARRALGAR